MSRTIGYVRVSTVDQDPALQIHALEAASVVEIFRDTTSGANPARPGLNSALRDLKPGDTIAVWRLDRLGRSLRQLLDTAAAIEARGAHLRSLTEAIDTKTATGRMLFHVLGALAEFERETIRERVTAGMAAAKREGRHVGRPCRMGPGNTMTAHDMLDKGKTWAEVCQVFDISMATLSRALRKYPASNFDAFRAKKLAMEIEGGDLSM